MAIVSVGRSDLIIIWDLLGDPGLASTTSAPITSRDTSTP
jgi:hypothetical protein